VKRFQGAPASRGAAQAKLDSVKAPGITFETYGIDDLCVYEAPG